MLRERSDGLNHRAGVSDEIQGEISFSDESDKPWNGYSRGIWKPLSLGAFKNRVDTHLSELVEARSYLEMV